jgi:Spy/CpxP family protein refolding chaperone
MRNLITSLLILLLTAGLSFPQGMMQGKQGQTGMMGRGMMGTQGGMMGEMPHMYSMMVQHVIMKANTLDLTDAQKKELVNIEEKYLYPLVQKEADFKISHMKIMSMLRDPNFDPSKVKAEIKASNDINLEMANMSIDALAAIRNAIGLENFKKARLMMPKIGGGMMQGASRTKVKEEIMKKLPTQEKKEDSSSEH